MNKMSKSNKIKKKLPNDLTAFGNTLCILKMQLSCNFYNLKTNQASRHAYFGYITYTFS